MYAEPKKIKDLKKGEFFCLRDPKYLDTTVNKMMFEGRNITYDKG